MRINLELDLDGVCADFDSGVKQLMGVYPDELDIKKDMWDAIHELMSNGGSFFGELPAMADFTELMDGLVEIINHGGDLEVTLSILTATGHIQPHKVRQEKIEWVKRNIYNHHPSLKGITINTCRKGRYKCDYVDPNITSILIDDRMKAIGPWREVGGIGILHTGAHTTLKKLREEIGI